MTMINHNQDMPALIMTKINHDQNMPVLLMTMIDHNQVVGGIETAAIYLMSPKILKLNLN